MKPTQHHPNDLAPLLAFGAHPDDIEFGCGAVITKETRAGRAAHFVVCSKGEAATNGAPAEREAEARLAAQLLGATIEFIELDGDAHLQIRTEHAIKLAGILRTARPGIVLAPTLTENQHPDHPKLGRLIRDAARLARYGGVKELRDLPPHTIGQLLYYAASSDAEPPDLPTVLVDVSDPQIMAAWTAAMEAHASQMATRKYVELQLARSRLNGLHAGVEHAIALFPNDPIIIDSLAQIGRGARSF